MIVLQSTGLDHQLCSIFIVMKVLEKENEP